MGELGGEGKCEKVMGLAQRALAERWLLWLALGRKILFVITLLRGSIRSFLAEAHGSERLHTLFMS